MLDWRAFTSSAICLCALAACHQNKIVHIEVFENYVAVEGVRSDLPIQQAADAQSHDHQGYVLLVPRPPLSAARLDELKRSMDKLYPERVQTSGGNGN
jgi:hypothetical protein